MRWARLVTDYRLCFVARLDSTPPLKCQKKRSYRAPFRSACSVPGRSGLPTARQDRLCERRSTASARPLPICSPQKARSSWSAIRMATRWAKAHKGAGRSPQTWRLVKASTGPSATSSRPSETPGHPRQQSRRRRLHAVRGDHRRALGEVDRRQPDGRGAHLPRACPSNGGARLWRSRQHWFDLAKQPEPGFIDYGACKAAPLLYLTKALAKQYAPTVRVNTVLPGRSGRAWTRPGGIVDQLCGALRHGSRHRGAAVSSGSADADGIGQPADVAHAVVFLASPLARFITGAALDIGGTIRGLI